MIRSCDVRRGEDEQPVFVFSYSGRSSPAKVAMIPVIASALPRRCRDNAAKSADGEKRSLAMATVHEAG